MKRIFIFVIVLSFVCKANAQVQSNTTHVQNSSDEKGQKFINEVLNRKPWEYWKECNDDINKYETLLQQAKTDKDNLQKQLDSYIEDYNKAKDVYTITDKDLYRDIITTPLAQKYDSKKVDYYMKIAQANNDDTNEDIKWIYNVYYPLLKNYGQHNQDLAKIIQGVIKTFEKIGDPDPNTEKTIFDDRLEETDYSKNYRWVKNINQEIKYLEDVIMETRSLFDDTSKFTKENFEEQLRRLEPVNN